MAEKRTGSVTEAEFEREAKSVFADGVNAMVEAERRGDKPVKLFGFLEVPAGMAIFGKLGYNALGQFGADRLQQPIYEGMQHLLGEQLYKLSKKELSTSTINKAAAATTFAASFVMKSGGYVLPFITTVFDQHNDQSTMARKIASALDELKGNHSELAYMMVSMDDNQVIAAHKAKMGKLYGSKRMAQISDLVFNAGLNLVSDIKQGMGMWKHGMSPDEITAGFHISNKEAPVIDVPLDANAQKLAAVRADKKAKSADLLKYVWGVAGAGVSDVAALSSKRKEKEILSHASTLQMIIALDEQISRNPNVRVQPPGENRDYSLEAYIMKVILNHQKEMADLNSSYSELRPALREELAELVKPMAEAIRNGDISAMSLLRLVGEPKKYPIILNHGRALATADEVETILEKMVGKKTHLRMENVDDFLARHNAKIQNLKEGFGFLEGDMRLKVMSIFPDTILEKAGIKAEEIKQVQEFRATLAYEETVAALTAGIAHEDEKDLKHTGLTTSQIKHMDEAAEQIHADKDAIKKLKASPTNASGVEEPMIDWALAQLDAKTISHIGTMEARGKELLASEDVAPMQRSFADRAKTGRSGRDNNPLDELADEFEVKGQHSSREKSRRASASHGYHEYE